MKLGSFVSDLRRKTSGHESMLVTLELFLFLARLVHRYNYVLIFNFLYLQNNDSLKMIVKLELVLLKHNVFRTIIQ